MNETNPNRVTLRIRTGEPVVAFDTLPFKVKPRIIVWGERVFMSREEGSADYYEEMAYCVPVSVAPPEKAS